MSAEDRERFVLSDDDVLTLARWAVLVEAHYSQLRQHADADGYRMGEGWSQRRALSGAGEAGTVHTQRDAMVLERFHLESRGSCW